MKATYLGHSAVMLEGSQTVLFDPFLTGNPKASRTAESIQKADFVIVTHDHEDHIGDAHAICKRTKAVFVGIHELAVAAGAKGIEAEGMNIGGSIIRDGCRFSIVHATHTCYTGHVVGVILEMDGKTLYHMGDTGLTADMKILPEFFQIDIAFVPIGDRYTMGPPSAARAVEWCGAKRAVPIHYNTWPPIEADPQEFAKRCPKGVAQILKPGEAIEV